MHQHNVIIGGLKFFERIGDGFLPVLSALYQFNFSSKFFVLQLAAESFNLIFSQCHHDVADLLVAGKYPEGMNQDRSAVDLDELFRGLSFFAGRRHTRTQSGGRNDCNYLHKRVKSITTLPISTRHSQ